MPASTYCPLILKLTQLPVLRSLPTGSFSQWLAKQLFVYKGTLSDALLMCFSQILELKKKIHSQLPFGMFGADSNITNAVFKNGRQAGMHYKELSIDTRPNNPLNRNGLVWLMK